MRCVQLAPLAVLLLAACGPPPAPEHGNAAAPGDTVDVHQVGTIAVVGSVPTEQLVLTTDRGRQLVLEGPQADELRRLTGMRVAVDGRGTGSMIRVERYRVLAVDGRPVISGIVERAEDGTLRLRTAEGQLYHLAEPPPELRAGQVVWIRGPASLRVQQYGVIREP